MESDVFVSNTAPERRANAFAAELLMPTKGLREVVAGRLIDKAVLTELMHEFDVSYRALLYRLADRGVGLLTAPERDKWLECSVTGVLRAGGDLEPQQWTTADELRRIPPRLWAAAQHGYRTGRVGLGVLSSLLDEDADELYLKLTDAESFRRWCKTIWRTCDAGPRRSPARHLLTYQSLLLLALGHAVPGQVQGTRRLGGSGESELTRQRTRKPPHPQAGRARNWAITWLGDPFFIVDEETRSRSPGSRRLSPSGATTTASTISARPPASTC